MSRYEEANKIYAKYGVDTEKALERLSKISVSVHCWQGDDVIGFDGSDSLSGGIQTRGTILAEQERMKSCLRILPRLFP